MKAVLFDMDGVIVDSEAHWRALETAFYRKAPGWREEHHERLTGLGVEDVYRFLREECGLDMSWEDFLKRSDQTARKVYLERVACAEGFVACARELKSRGLKLGLASSSPTRWVKLVLDRFALAPLFDAVATADDVGQRTKPLPDLYVEALRRLGVAPADGLAVEDSSAGIRSAKAAGLRVAAYRTGHNGDQDLSEADLVIRDFPSLLREVGRPA